VQEVDLPVVQAENFPLPKNPARGQPQNFAVEDPREANINEPDLVTALLRNTAALDTPTADTATADTATADTATAAAATAAAAAAATVGPVAAGAATPTAGRRTMRRDVE
jgi:hypothetical protein